MSDVRGATSPRSADSRRELVEVVVVGAGIGGLQAAAALQRVRTPSGQFSVRVLEARDRVGGRVFSTPVDGGCIDLGATWFWANEPLINEFVDTTDGLGAFPQHLAGDMMFQRGGVQRVSGNQLDAPSMRLAAGMQSVASALAARLPADLIEFGQAVTSIHRTATGIDVSTDAQTIEARHVVLAIPPALAVATIDFAGGLADRVRAVAAATPVWMGEIVKVAAVFDRAFWREEGLAGSAFSYDGPMREIHDMSGPGGAPAALFGFCSLAPAHPAPTRQDVIDQLVSLFGPMAAAPLDVAIMDWRREPHTMHPGAIGLTDYSTYGHSVFQAPALEGRLHWAGTETSPTAPGHIEGALTAGVRAATAITRSVA